jgi:glycerol-3-phosphate dehydrogenase
MAAQESNRIVFAIPRHEMIIVGTTDTDYSGDPSDAKAEFEDVKYLLEVTNRYFPGAELKPEDIISSYVGVRPLVKDDSGNEGKTSREHTILKDPRGFHFVAGGKYTTYRLMSEQIVDSVLKTMPLEKRMLYRKCETVSPLNEYVGLEDLRFAESQAATANEIKLIHRYGLEGFEILEKFDEDLSYWQIEAHHAIYSTMCHTLTDFYTRRVPLMLAYEDHGLQFLEEISQVFKKELILTTAEIEKQKQDLLSYIEHELSWKKYFSKN